MDTLKNLEPKLVFYYFEEISKIPHGSKNMKQISDYCVEFAKEHGFEYIQDEWYNVIIKKNGTNGYEDAPPIILQGHLDMVCEKGNECTIDFGNDGLDLRVEGDYVYAFDTTLGGDDGIAIAYSLAILASDTLEHPPLEVVFTSDEEIGLIGADKIDLSTLKGKRLLNIDSEDEGTFLTSCAGGAKAVCSIPVDYIMVKGMLCEITINGLLGGHSGMEIDKKRGNSNIIMGRLLQDLRNSMPYTIASLDGGFKDNAIPRETNTMIMIDEHDTEKLIEFIQTFDSILKNEYKTSDPNITISCTIKELCKKEVLSPKSRELVLFFLRNIPDGIQEMSPDIKGLVETSLNAGIIKLGHDTFELHTGIRSSIETAKDDLVEKLRYLTEFLGGEIRINGIYPAWEYRKDSPLRELIINTYQDLYGEAPNIEAIHAGLECGIFSKKIEDLDCVSFGPNIEGIHTTQERLSISSTKRVWDYLVEVLKRAKN